MKTATEMPVGPEFIEKVISIGKYGPLMQEIHITLQEDRNIKSSSTIYA